MAFNQKEYIDKYKKEHYKKISINLPKEEAKELEDLCKEVPITKIEVMRIGIKETKKIKVDQH